MKEKKGIQLHEAAGAVLTLVLIAVLVIVGIYMFVNLQTSFPTVRYTATNESGFLNTSGYTLVNSTVCNYGSPSIVSITNHTDGAIVPTTNYTLTNSTLTSFASKNWSTVDIIYSYSWGGQACVASQVTITNWSNYPALVGLIGTIILLSLVIGILITSFVFGGKNRP